MSSTHAASDPASASSAIATRHAEAEESAGFVLWRVATMWQREVRTALEPTGLTHGQFVLLTSAVWLEAQSASRNDAVTQARIGSHARTDAVTTSEVLRTLERKKLLRRLDHPTDGRAKVISATRAGVRLVRRAVPLVEAVDDAIFGAPSPELRRLAELLGAQTDVHLQPP